MESTAIERRNRPEIDGLTPTGKLLQLVLLQDNALDKQATVEAIRSLTELMREERDYQAKVSFEEALSRVQDKVGWVAKDVERSDGKGSYASFEGLDEALRPIYVSEGFSVSFDADPRPPQGQHIVIAYVSRQGHTRTYHLPVFIDPNGPKGGAVMTMTDAGTAAHSKGCRILLGRIFNIATGVKETGLAPQDADKLDQLVKQMKDSATIEDCKDAYGKAFAAARKIANSDATIRVIDTFEDCKRDFERRTK